MEDVNPIARHASSLPDRSHRAAIVAVALFLALVALAVGGGALVWKHDGAITSIDAGEMPGEQAGIEYPFSPSKADMDGDGVDDYTDIVAGARADAEALPTYDDGYYQGGYPPEDKGACTDLVWRAFRQAGYDLKAMVDADVAADPSAYAAAASSPDPNIDFRRTGVLDVFFSKYGQTLTTATTTDADKQAWQAGDIVVFEHTRHIGIVSDKRDSDGLPFILHNMGQQQRENDYLAFHTHMTVTGHYRFDATKIPASLLKAWNE